MLISPQPLQLLFWRIWVSRAWVLGLSTSQKSMDSSFSKWIRFQTVYRRPSIIVPSQALAAARTAVEISSPASMGHAAPGSPPAMAFTSRAVNHSGR